MSKISAAIKEAAMRNTKLYCELATVDSVDKKSRTIKCTTYNDDSLIEVQMQSVVDGDDGVLIVPEVGSDVILGFLDKNNSFVILYSKIDEVLIDVKNNIVINGGKNEGLVKIKELTAKLNDLIDSYNMFVATYNLHTHQITMVDGVQVVNATTNSGSSAKLFNKSDYENEKIKH